MVNIQSAADWLDGLLSLAGLNDMFVNNWTSLTILPLSHLLVNEPKLILMVKSKKQDKGKKYHLFASHLLANEVTHTAEQSWVVGYLAMRGRSQ